MLNWKTLFYQHQYNWFMDDSMKYLHIFVLNPWSHLRQYHSSFMESLNQEVGKQWSQCDKRDSKRWKKSGWRWDKRWSKSILIWRIKNWNGGFYWFHSMWCWGQCSNNIKAMLLRFRWIVVSLSSKACCSNFYIPSCLLLCDLCGARMQAGYWMRS